MLKITDINQGDLLTFKAADNKFKVLLCTSTRKNKSPQYFTFAALTYDSFDKPTTSNINYIVISPSLRWNWSWYAELICLQILTFKIIKNCKAKV